MANRPRHPKDQDRNFDDLADHFNKKIYGSLKGQIRLAVLERDFERHLPRTASGLNALDVGGGQGHVAKVLARFGYHVHLIDISVNMLKQAEVQLCDELARRTVELEVASLQELSTRGTQYDLVCCHAVLEWLAHPAQAITQLMKLLKPGGLLSILFYNRDALVFRNLLRGNLRAALQEDPSGEVRSLTPLNPQSFQVVSRQLQRDNAIIRCRSGVRVYVDYMDRGAPDRIVADQLIGHELYLSDVDPFWRLGRYIHLIAEKQWN